jgi:hypothetical protein
MDDGTHNNGWTPTLAWINTAFTVVGGVSGIAALVIACLALLRAG